MLSVLCMFVQSDVRSSPLRFEKASNVRLVLGRYLRSSCVTRPKRKVRARAYRIIRLNHAAGFSCLTFSLPRAITLRDVHCRSMAACERSGKRPPPDSQDHALARAALATWLAPSRTTIKGTPVSVTCPGSLSPAPTSTGLPADASKRCQYEPQQQEARKDYVRHCLTRSAIAARAVGRAVKKATGAGGGGVAAGEITTSALSAAGALRPAVAEEEHVCRFLLGEIHRVVAEVEAEDRGAGGAASALTPAPRAHRLLGLGLTANATAASVGAVDAFLTAVLKHRLVDAASLRAVRAVACTLFQQQAPPKQRQRKRTSSHPLEAVAMEDCDSDQGQEAAGGEEEEEDGGERQGGVGCGTEDNGDDSAAATATEVAATTPVLPGWSAATMLER